MNDNINEIWQDIPNYEGKYQISNFGRIKSLNYRRTNQEKILCPRKNRDGYLFVNLCKNGKVKNCSVHRLVANAFIPNPSNLSTVNHKDENKENNRVDNLEWCTQKENVNYGTAQARRVANTDYKSFQARRVANTDYKARTANTDYKARTANTDYKARTANTDYKAIADKQSRKVFQYDKDGNLIKIWNSTAECGRNGFDQRHISKCCRGKLKSHRGFIWSYFPI